MADTMLTADALSSTHVFELDASDYHSGDSVADRSCGDEAFYQETHVWIRLR
jgi:hypothetical protein